MDRFGHSAPSLDELKQIVNEARSSNSLKNLRIYFDRVQELRRIHSGNFDVQLVVAEAQEVIIERARELRSRPGSSAEENNFTATNPDPRPAESQGEAVERGTDPSRAEVKHLNSRSWRRATFLALLLTAVICVVFFYLIQAARKINLAPPPQEATHAKTAETTKVPVQNAKATESATQSNSATVRLYTDLVPGTVSVDDGEPQDLKDGELVLDHLEGGRHSIKIAGRSGTAAFSFDVAANSAPQVVAPVTAANAIAVLVSSQDGKGHLMTSLPQADVSLDGNAIGNAGPDGLSFENLGTIDHELQIGQGKDRQRFVMTYTSAPVLTVYVKSDPNAGTVTIATKQDRVAVFIDDKPYRRKTDHGQLRIPLRAGQYVVHVHKDGFIDPPPQSVNVKKGEETELSFRLEQLPSLATLQLRGGVPGTAVYVDKEQVATVGADGAATVSTVKSGDHIVELRLDGSVPKRFQREFQARQTVFLNSPDTLLEKVAIESKPAQELPAANSVQKMPVASSALEIPGEQVRRGGGFVHYNVPKTSGRYSFQAHSKIGGFLKHEKLQWYAGYENSENYVMFSVDGKHATVRQMVDGRSTEVARVPFNASSGEWVQVELSVKPDSIDA
ncbi:MAG: hypothetical protein M3Y24_01100, partial [Acidobacteriota bacterium]|nr:hypothetical protein [Acidobacteriota bacterium]